MKKRKDIKIIPSFVGIRTVESELLRFHRIISKLLEDYEHLIDFVSVAQVWKSFPKDASDVYSSSACMAFVYRYEASFKSGAFNEQTVTLKRDYFRFFDDDELTNLVINTLSACDSYVFKPKKSKFVKRMVLLA